MKILNIWQQLSRAQKDVIKAALLVLFFYLIVLEINLAETLAERLEKFEHLQLDEVPFLLLFIAIALAWFARRRVTEQTKEIALRIAAEKINAQLLTENKALTHHVLKVQELERLQLARDLHDDIGQYLLAIRLDASSLTIDANNPDALPARRILSNAGHIQQMTRILMRRLRPAPTNSQNCVDAIRLMIQEWQDQQANITFELHISEPVNHFSEEVSVAVYRLIQEALTNIAKHAQAKHVSVSLDLVTNPLASHPQLLCLEIKDDGKGLDAQAAPHGMGMIGMRERISAVNGEFLVHSNTPQGLIVCARIPVNPT
ncbi:MAG: histidine kinase [Methylotenera sp.]|nr:histidine kinase [Methylotenera sp.]